LHWSPYIVAVFSVTILPMKRNTSLVLFLLLSLVIPPPVPSAGQQLAAKRPLAHRDYDSWKSIAPVTLSRDGKFLAYGLFPQEGDGEVIVRNLTSGKEFRYKAGE